MIPVPRTDWVLRAHAAFIDFVVTENRSAVSRDAVFITEIVYQRCRGAILCFGWRQVVEMLFLAVGKWIVHATLLDCDVLDSNASLVNIFRPCVPSTIGLSNKLNDLAVLTDEIVSTGSGSRRLEGFYRAAGGRCICDMDNDHINGLAAAAVIVGGCWYKARRFWIVRRWPRQTARLSL